MCVVSLKVKVWVAKCSGEATALCAEGVGYMLVVPREIQIATSKLEWPRLTNQMLGIRAAMPRHLAGKLVWRIFRN
jgi:hypothetical protein